MALLLLVPILIGAIPDASAKKSRARSSPQTSKKQTEKEDKKPTEKPEDTKPKGTLEDARKAYDVRNYKEALIICNSIVKARPKDADAFAERSRAQIKLFRIRQGVDDLTKAINLKPKNPDYYMARAEAYIDWGEFERAIRDYSEALKNGVKDRWKAFERRAHCYHMINANSQVIDDLTEAIAIKKDGDLFHRRGDAFRNLRRYKNASEDYAEAVKANPEDHMLRLKLGLALDQIRQYEEAVKEYTKMIELAPDYYRGYYQRANSYYQMAEYKKALDDITASIREYRSWNPKKLYQLRSSINAKLGNSAAAAKDRAKYAKKKKGR